MKDFWDGIVHWWGYEYWNWGSAADWFGALGSWLAAIGTLAAVAVSLHLLRVERNQRIQSDARLVSLHQRFESWQGMSPGNAHVHLTVRNNAPRPIFDIYIDEFEQVGDTVVRNPVLTIRELNPGERATDRSTYPRTKNTEHLARFTDSNGKVWYRSLKTQQDMSAEEYENRRVASVLTDERGDEPGYTIIDPGKKSEPGRRKATRPLVDTSAIVDAIKDSGNSKGTRRYIDRVLPAVVVAIPIILTLCINRRTNGRP